MTYPGTSLLGNRLNAFRLNYVLGHLWINIGGAWTGPGQGVVIDSLTINDRLNDVPNTLIARVRGTAPTVGQVIHLAIGSQAAAPLFIGHILRVTRVWAAQNPRFVLHDIEAIDPTWRLQAGMFSARYRNQSATAIAASLLTHAPAGYTGRIEPNLPILDEISFTNTTVMDAFVQLATRIGGYTRCDYTSQVSLFRTADDVPPLLITAAHPSVADVSLVRDLTQVVTRAIVEGGGGTAIANIPAGSTVLPVDVAGWYNASGGLVRSGPQRIAYQGVRIGGTGAYVGAGTTPTTAPTLTGALGASAVEAGTHQYAYTWVTAAGETLPSPVGSVVTGAPPPAPDPPPIPYALINVSGTNHLTIGVTYAYAYGWSYSPLTPAAGGRLDQSAITGLSAGRTVACVAWSDPLNPPNPKPSWTAIGYLAGSVDPQATYLLWYRFVAGTWRLLFGVPIADMLALPGTPNTFVDGESDAEMAAHAAHPAPGPGNVIVNRWTVSGVAPGPSGTTARKVYRTAANGSQLRLLTTIANNSDTALPAYDNTPDASLGANAPTIDTAGITQQNKVVKAGESEIPVTSTAPFTAAGGYAIVSGQVIRYTGVSATALTGVPPDGEGALQASVAWGTPIIVANALLGLPPAGPGAIVEPILRGDPVNIVVVVDDAPAQAALATAIGGDGVRESLLVDGRIGIPEATARGRALLEQRKAVRETVAHRSRDQRTQSGALVTVDLPAPTDIHGTYRVQDLQIARFNPTHGPSYTSRSSTDLFTFEDLIRQMTNTAPPPATGE